MPGDPAREVSGSDTLAVYDSAKAVDLKEDNTIVAADTVLPATNTIRTGNLQRDSLVAFARTLLGVPYKYASTDPTQGFDCSGFITYVFNHFGISVPRSSIDFTNQGREVAVADARPGDLILFTGTDSTDRRVGHMGIIVSNADGKTEFIHSTSGKAYSVVITPFERYYRSRFVKVIRVFPG
jgi:cell wall-associated NlpC family hydrolase